MHLTAIGSAPDGVLATFAEAAGHADLVVNAAGGAVSIEVLDHDAAKAMVTILLAQLAMAM